jgi:hypothetical protein
MPLTMVPTSNLSSGYQTLSASTCLSPVTDYYVRTLIRQSFSHLVSTYPEYDVSIELWRRSIAVLNRLKSINPDWQSAVQNLEVLSLQHQTLCAQGEQFRVELVQIEEQILGCFGLKLIQQGRGR